MGLTSVAVSEIPGVGPSEDEKNGRLVMAVILQCQSSYSHVRCAWFRMFWHSYIKWEHVSVNLILSLFYSVFLVTVSVCVCVWIKT